MRRALLVSITLFTTAAIGVGVGCGGDDSVQNVADGGGSLDGAAHDGSGGPDSGLGGDARGGGGEGGSCHKFSDICASNADCCSNLCDPKAHTCASSISVCEKAGASCAAPTDCCSLVCSGGACGATQCISDTQACTASADCCSSTCGAAHTCTPLNTSCKTAGNSCAASSQCCSGLCDKASGTCALASSFCIQPGDICARDNDCCTGICSIDADAGAKVGVCIVPPNGGKNNCTGGTDGVLCTSCGTCCSDLCAPYATGISVCQPANGCHVEGDLCRSDSDCCNTNPNGSGGTGVTCIITAPNPVGYCSSPNGCRPLGDTCHFKNYVCGNSTSANDCCAVPNPSNKICELDPLGVPRCAVATCVTAGQACSNSLDCCTAGGKPCASADGGLAVGCTPCVPGPNGTLACAALNPDGGVACQQGGQFCTVNADCCSGEMCVVPPGGTQGACSVTTPPPADAGAGSDGGTVTGDSGSATDAAASCSLYGQSCTQASDCCNSIPCTLSNTPCSAGQAGCACISIIR